ncbi:MAG: hypothetical protein AB1540_01410, partial [Bdellovibrionota bacterium]
MADPTEKAKKNMSLQPGAKEASATEPLPVQGGSEHSFGPGANQPAIAQTPAKDINLDDGVISDKVQVILVKPHNETVEKLGQYLGKDEAIKIHEVPTGSVPAFAKALVPALVVASIMKTTDVVKFLTMLKPLKEDLKYNYIKFI